MKLRPLIRVGLGLAMLVAVSTAWIAIGDRHWGAALVLGALALASAYPALTGRDPLNRRYRRRKHRRHRSKRHETVSGTPVPGSQTSAAGLRGDDSRP
jgi:hypothetical protein